MKYQKVVPGRFISRPNRFVAQCEIDGTEESVHVKNTGRCKELLLPDTPVYLEFSDKPGRKTRYSLVTVEKGERLVNIDSQAPNKVVFEGLKKKTLQLPGMPCLDLIRPEYTHGRSRFDFYLEGDGRKALLEVKGVTLERNGEALFPDAPTQRGVRHVHELTAAREADYLTYILFVIQMKDVCCFMPNDETHPAFGEALRLAASQSVKILAYDCLILPDGMEISDPVKVAL